MADSQRLIQRNKNVLADVQMKQQMEQKKTLEFLKYSLSNRPHPDFMKNIPVVQGGSIFSGGTISVQNTDCNNSVVVTNSFLQKSSILPQLVPGTDLKQSFSTKHGGDLTFNTTPLHSNLTPTKLKSSLLLKKRNEDLKNLQSNNDDAGGNSSTPRV